VIFISVPSPLSTIIGWIYPPIPFCTFNGREVFKSVPSLVVPLDLALDLAVGPPSRSRVKSFVLSI
jgi:hypothetical protein